MSFRWLLKICVANCTSTRRDQHPTKLTALPISPEVGTRFGRELVGSSNDPRRRRFGRLGSRSFHGDRRPLIRSWTGRSTPKGSQDLVGPLHFRKQSGNHSGNPTEDSLRVQSAGKGPRELGAAIRRPTKGAPMRLACFRGSIMFTKLLPLLSIGTFQFSHLESYFHGERREGGEGGGLKPSKALKALFGLLPPQKKYPPANAAHPNWTPAKGGLHGRGSFDQFRGKNLERHRRIVTARLCGETTHERGPGRKGSVALRQFMVVVGFCIFPIFDLVVVEWLKSKSTELLKFKNCCSPSNVNQGFLLREVGK